MSGHSELVSFSTVYIENLLSRLWLREVDQREGKRRIVLCTGQTSHSLLCTSSSNNTYSTPHSVTAAAHSDDVNRTLYDGSTGGVANGVGLLYLHNSTVADSCKHILGQTWLIKSLDGY